MTTIQTARRNHPVAVAVFAAAYLALMAFVLMPQQSAEVIGAETRVAFLD